MRPSTALLSITAGGLGVLALWWHDTPPIRGAGEWLTNAGRITGLLAGYVVVIALLLMARIPAIEHGLGTVRLTRWHSMAGRYLVSLAVAHTLLIIWGYALSAHQNLVGQTGILLLSYPDVLMATVALGLFVGIAVISARAARRRLRYETWYHLHFYTYLAIALSFAHQFATGADFMGNPPARLLWSALYIGAAAAVVWYRFATPIRQMFRHRLRVARVVDEAPGIFSVYLVGRHLHELAAEPGQFFRWRFLSRGQWWQSHPYSLSAPPRGSLLRITVKSLGDHSTSLRHIRLGTPVLASGPFGALTPALRRARKVLLLAGGIGITPLRALFEAMPAHPGEITLVYRASSPREAVFKAELDQIARRRGAVIHYLFGPAGSPADPLVGTRLARLIPDLRSHDVYLCGPPGMVSAALAALRRARVPRSRIHTEAFEF
ncbi:MAG: ferredoxin reductase family protein [Acidothermus sp.]|nr:ferredoxin reductase family protein [Acidothermus sp.]MCL6537296.1 ferredoxin reductase family protein [Acidothermus sp.]